MDGMGEALGKAVRLFLYVPQANCLPGKTNYIMKLGQTQNFGHSREKSSGFQSSFYKPLINVLI